MSNKSKGIAIIIAPVTLLNESAILVRLPVCKKDTFTNTAVGHYGFLVCLYEDRVWQRTRNSSQFVIRIVLHHPRNKATQFLPMPAIQVSLC